jgi:hypothetical protein
MDGCLVLLKLCLHTYIYMHFDLNGHLDKDTLWKAVHNLFNMKLLTSYVTFSFRTDFFFNKPEP